MQGCIRRQSHGDATGVPAAGDQSAKSSLRSGLGIGMKPLWVVGFGEAQHFRLVNNIRACLNHLPDRKVCEFHAIAFMRAGPAALLRSRALLSP